MGFLGAYALDYILPSAQEISLQKILASFLWQETWPLWTKSIFRVYTRNPFLIDQITVTMKRLFTQLVCCDSTLLVKFFDEDMNEASITSLDAIVDLYCAVATADISFQCLGETVLAAGKISTLSPLQSTESLMQIQKFGLCSTRHGSSFDWMNFPHHSTHSFVDMRISKRGSMLCVRGYTSLLHFIWTLAGIDAGYDFVLRESVEDQSSGHNPSLLGMQLRILAICGYTEIQQPGFGVKFKAPTTKIEYDLPRFLADLDQDLTLTKSAFIIL